MMKSYLHGGILKMNKLFNTSFESGLRSLLVLYTVRPKQLTIDRIAAYDFITLYSHSFGITEYNLHGNSIFNFSELASKRARCSDGVKEFVLNGLIYIKRTNSGISYGLSDLGLKYIESLTSDYTIQYLRINALVHEKYKGLSDEDLLQMINKKAIQELRR